MILRKSHSVYSTQIVSNGLYFFAITVTCFGHTTFKAAVFEYAPTTYTPDKPNGVATKEEAKAVMMKNIDVYRKQVRQARRNEVEIIVFPENGLYGYDFTRESIKPYLDYVPDPDSIPGANWSPCIEPKRFDISNVRERKESIGILKELSCIAWENEVYVVANMGSKEDCMIERDSYCPDGQYQFNTNVVFDKQGALIARYRKYYLYHEKGFDRPSSAEIKTFNTSFGLFGTFTAGDILYRQPAAHIVKRCRVDTVAVPMTWDNTFPFPLAIEVQQGYSMSLGVNLLVANTLEPRYKIGGSGIYTSTGAIQYHYNRHSFKEKLLIAELPIHPKKPESLPFSLKKPLNEETTEFSRIINGNLFKFVSIVKTHDEIKICEKNFCCNLKYNIDRTKNVQLQIDNFVLGIFSGRHNKFIDLEIQVCGVIKCAGGGVNSCGRRTFSSKTMFSQFTLWGSFVDKESVFPFVFLNGMSLGAKDFQYDSGMIYAKKGFKRPLINAVLLGRNYARDPTLHPQPVNRSIEPNSRITTMKPTKQPGKRKSTTIEKPNNDGPKTNIPNSASKAFNIVIGKLLMSLTGINVYFGLQMSEKHR